MLVYVISKVFIRTKTFSTDREDHRRIDPINYYIATTRVGSKYTQMQIYYTKYENKKNLSQLAMKP